MTRYLRPSVFCVLLVVMTLAVLPAQEQRVQQLEEDVQALRQDLEGAFGAYGLVSLLYGAFCALWAQNTGRSAWLWFFLGLMLNVIAVLVVLSKNSADSKRRSNQKPPSSSAPLTSGS